jgi:hypothetical protein
LDPNLVNGHSDVDDTFAYMADVSATGFYHDLHETYPALRLLCAYFMATFLGRDDNQNLTFNVFHLDDHRTNNDLEA